MIGDARITAGFVFAASLIIYLLTIAPTLSFWDCGEFIACSYRLSIPHPPGAPLFILIGRLFTFIPFGDIGLRVNLISAFATAGTNLFLFLTILRLIEEWKGPVGSTPHVLFAQIAAALAALSFAFTDTVWFNAVETEVYGLSLFLTSFVYWLTLKWMDNFKDFRSVRFLLLIVYIFGLGAGVHLLNLLVLPSIVLLIIFAQRHLLIRIDLWLMIPVLTLIGFSIYCVILIRSGLDPNIDQNNPENWNNLLNYINRKQYIQESQILSIFDRKAPLWEYQIKHLFFRYFGWQFIGKGLTLDQRGFIIENLSLRLLYGLPFLMGLWGCCYHFLKDWKRASGNLLLWTMTGIAITIYLNQENPQPRERDYVYVGCYYAFAVWIGIGIYSAFTIVHRVFQKRKNLKHLSLAITGTLLLLALPVNLLVANYHEHDRSGNYLAWDFSNNILQSCQQDAILFTHGDNDTFPLWYLQEVENIRTDVRVVNLSYLNTAWYIKQMKNMKPQVPIRLSDEDIDKLNLQIWPADYPQTFPVQIRITPVVNRYYMREVLPYQPLPDTAVTITFSISPTLTIGDNKYFRVQDQMVIEILSANQFQRPIYFASTVGKDNLIGLGSYLRADGTVLKLVTATGLPPMIPILEENLFKKYRYRTLNDTRVYRNTTNRNMMQNYRLIFAQLALEQFNNGNAQRAVEILDSTFSLIPESVLPISDYHLALNIGKIYFNSGRRDELAARLEQLGRRKDLNRAQRLELGNIYLKNLKDTAGAEGLIQPLTADTVIDPAPYQILLNIYQAQNRTDNIRTLLQRWLELNPSDQAARQILQQIQSPHSQPTQ